jgi:hypothetical protein
VRYSVVCISVRREMQRSNAKISSSPENSARCPEERNTVCCGDSCASWQFRTRSSGLAAWAHSPNRRFGSARKADGRSARPTPTARCREPSVKLHIPSAPKTDPPCAHVGAVWVRVCASARPLRVGPFCFRQCHAHRSSPCRAWGTLSTHMGYSEYSHGVL